MFRSRRARWWSWILSVLVSMLVIGTATSIASPFVGYTAENAISGAVILFAIIPWWVWSWRRGRLPVVRVFYHDTDEAVSFREWQTARDAATAAEFAEFKEWRAARAAAQGQAAAAPEEKPPPSPPMIDAF